MGLRKQECDCLQSRIHQISPPQAPTQDHQKNQDAPHHWNQPIYCANTQYSDTDTTELVDDQSTLYVQKVYGILLYYTIVIDQTMLVALNTIATAQAHANTTTMGNIVWFFNYASTHPDVTLHYCSS